MTPKQLSLPPGLHDLDGQIAGCEIEFLGAQGLAKIVLAVSTPLSKERSPPEDRPATKLVVYTDRAMTFELLKRLEQMTKNVGWSRQQ